MEIRTSKKLMDLLTKELRKYTPEYNLSLAKLDRDRCIYAVGYASPQDYRNGKYQLFRVEYPAEYYTMNRYISTFDLNKVFDMAEKPVTLESFGESFFEMVEI